MLAPSLAGSLQLFGIAVLASRLEPRARAAATVTARWLAAGAVLIALGGCLQVTITIGSLADRLGESPAALLPDYLLETRSGRLNAARIGLPFLLLALLGWLMRQSAAWRTQALRAAALAGVLGTAVLLAASGHAPATAGGGWTVVIQALHLSLAALWAGLVLGVLAATRPGPALHEALRDAGNRALVYVLALAGTGVLLAWWHGAGPANLLHTGYGLTLLGKLAVFTLALAAAATNRWYALPAAEDGGRPHLPRRLLLLEAGGIGLILLAAATLTRTPPLH